MLRRWSSGRSAGLRQAQVNGLCPDSGGHAGDGRLRLLSFNIQVGISTERYRHYLTRGWQHLLPHHGRAGNLQRIGALLADYDLVALQEVDGGSLRSGYINQVERLAELGAFPYWYQQLNRDLGRLAQHSNGVLSRLRPDLVEDHPLPGPPGRGAILVRFGEGADALAVVGEWMRHPHPRLHLILVSRHDPQLPLSEWRARNQMVDIRSVDLRFNLEETTAFLHEATHRPLDSADIAQLHANTEGWPAGLRLAALSLSFVSDEDAGHILEFPGRNRNALGPRLDRVRQPRPGLARRSRGR